MRAAYGLLFFVLFSMEAAAIQEASKVVDIDILESSGVSCLSQNQRVNFVSDTAFGFIEKSKPVVRVRIPASIVQERISVVGLKVVVPGYEIFDLGAGSRIADGKREATYRFDLPREAVRRMGKGARFHAQTLIFTERNEYVASRSIRTFHADEVIEAYYSNGECHFVTPPVVVSELYQNRDGIHALDIEYTPKGMFTEARSGDVAAGVIQISDGSATNSSLTGSGAASAGTVSGTFYTADEWRSQMESSSEVVQHFTLGPKSFAYIVRQDVVVVSHVQRLRFNKCGVLTGRKEDVSLRERVLPAYTLMSLGSTDFNNLDRINEKLSSYPSINTCVSGGVK